jgi:ketosteroid isomerase-like protein
MPPALSPALQLDELRWKALVGNDLDLLDSMFADDMTYIHSNGMRDSKDTYLGALRNGVFRYLSIDVSEAQAHSHGNTTVITGRAVATTRSGAGELISPLTYTAVWSLVADEWKFVAWHSCPSAS